MTDLDPVIHAPARLRIMVALASLPHGDQVSFPRLQEELGMTAGNLSTHARKLEDAAYLSQEKTYRGRTPVTYLSLTDTGRAALASYRATLSEILGGSS